MPRTCTICAHPEVEAINQALLVGDPYRGIAQRFAASPDAVYRHKQDHLPVTLIQAKAAQQATDADELLAQVRTLHTKALRILATAEGAGKLPVALQAIREARGCLELLAKLLGELPDGPTTTVNILISPEWQRVRGVLLQAVRPYPAIKTVIAAALLSLESPDAP